MSRAVPAFLVAFFIASFLVQASHAQTTRPGAPFVLRLRATTTCSMPHPVPSKMWQ
jgi:hypothetical protein